MAKCVDVLWRINREPRVMHRTYFERVLSVFPGISDVWPAYHMLAVRQIYVLHSLNTLYIRCIYLQICSIHSKMASTIIQLLIQSHYPNTELNIVPILITPNTRLVSNKYHESKSLPCAHEVYALLIQPLCLVLG